MSYDIVKREAEKMHTLDRVIVLQPIEGRDPISTSGNVDKRLFSGDNKLHAVFNNQNGMWHLRYEKGGIPASLDMQFVELPKLMDYVRNYFEKRNVEIVEVQG